MRPPARLLPLFAILAATLCSTSLTQASPVVLDPAGIPVCTATGEQTLPRTVAGANGAAIIVWQDTRRGGSLRDLYAQSIEADGSVTPGWPADGLVLCASGTASAPMPVPDGAGGMLVFWQDSRNDGQLFAQRVSATGVIAAGWPADGKQITTKTIPMGFNIAVFDAIPDGAGGAFVARKTITPFFGGYLGVVNRITADGTFPGAWTEDGTSVDGGDFSTPGPTGGRLAEDPGSGVFFAMRKQGPSPENHETASITRIAGGGGKFWEVALTSPNINPSVAEGIRSIDVAGDGAAGCFATWHVMSYAPPPAYEAHDEYVQRYVSGTGQWALNTASPTYQYVEMDGGGGAFLIGSVYPGNNLEVHRRNPDGSIPGGWTASGISVSTPTTLGLVARNHIDGDLLLCWSENRSGGGFDIRGIAVDTSGVVESGWETDGKIISDATGNQGAPDLAVMSPTQVLACWQDARSGASDIYASRIGFIVTGVPPDGGRSARLALGAAWPNPARDQARFSIALAPGKRASAEVVDMSGRVVRRIGSLESGTSQEFQVDTRGLTSGVYWFRVTQGSESATRRFAVLR